MPWIRRSRIKRHWNSPKSGSKFYATFIETSRLRNSSRRTWSSSIQFKDSVGGGEMSLVNRSGPKRRLRGPSLESQLQIALADAARNNRANSATKQLMQSRIVALQR